MSLQDRLCCWKPGYPRPAVVTQTATAVALRPYTWLNFGFYLQPRMLMNINCIACVPAPSNSLSLGHGLVKLQNVSGSQASRLVAGFGHFTFHAALPARKEARPPE